MGTESEMILLSGHLFVSLHVGHARRSRLVLNYRINVSGSPDLIFFNMLNISLSIFQMLGKGSFGVVLRGRWRQMDVAIKVFQTEQEHAAFLVELRQLSR